MFSSRLAISLFLVVLAFSCEEKATVSIAFPSAYYKAGVEPAGSLRIFSAAGEIKKNAVVGRFSRSDTSYFRSFARFLLHDPGTIDTIRFVDSLRAVLTVENQKIDSRLTTDGNIILLSETSASGNCCFNDEVFTRSLPYHIATLKPVVHSEFIFSSALGNYRFGYRGLRNHVLKESGGQLVAPLILYTLHSGRFENGFVNNLLNPDFFSFLSPGDTVSIMEFQIRFEK